MAFAFPVYVASGTLAATKLPTYEGGGTFVVAELRFPPYAPGSYRTEMFVPTYMAIGTPPLDFSLAASSSAIGTVEAVIEFVPFEMITALTGVSAVESVIVMEAVEVGDVSAKSAVASAIQFPQILDFETSIPISAVGSVEAVVEANHDVTSISGLCGVEAEIELSSPAHGALEAEAPMSSAVLTARYVFTATITATAPGPGNVEMVGGAQNIVATAPMATAVITGLVGQNGQIAATAPMAATAFTAVLTGVGTIAGSTRTPYTAELTGVQTNVGTITAPARMATASLTAFQGITTTLVVTAPAATAALSGGQGGSGTIAATAPRSRVSFLAPQSLTTAVATVVVNTITAAVTEFQNYNYDSYCKLGSTLYGAGADGIYELDSSGTDNGTAIDAQFTLGNVDFGSEYLKRVESLYAAYRSTGDVLVTVTMDEGRPYTYVMKHDGYDTLRQRRVPIGKGLKGKYVQLKIANTGGASFGFDTFNLLAHETVRRIGA